MFHSLSSRAGHSVSHAVEQRQGSMPRWRRFAIALAVTACAWANPLAALAAYTCSGKITLLQHGPEGDVTISLQGDGTTFDAVRLCNVTFAVGSIQPAHCRSILALVMTAQVTDRPVTFWFDFNYSGPPKCSPADHPAWTYLTGWYWGPAMSR